MCLHVTNSVKSHYGSWTLGVGGGGVALYFSLIRYKQSHGKENKMTQL